MTELSNLSHRPMRDDHDFAAMRALVSRRYAEAAAAGVGPYDLPWYPSRNDLDWWRCNDGHDFGSSLELWFEGETLIGFIWHYRDRADIITAWQARDAYPTLLDWAERRSVERVIEQAHADGVASPETYSYEEPLFVRDSAKRAILEARGYAKTERSSIDHWYDLTGDLPPRRTLPDGFVIRPLAGPQEVEARVSVHRSAFAPSRMTVDKYRILMALPGYRSATDLVVEAPSWPKGVPAGEEGCSGSPCFAAFTIVWYDEANRMGVFEPVGCRPEFQRRGLASAVIIEGMHRLKAAGATHCWIGANGDSPGAKTYAALGGYPAQPYEWWARALPVPPTDPPTQI